MSDRGAAALLWLALVAVGGLAWALELRPRLVVADASALEGTPRRIGSWVGEDRPLEPGIEDVLRADFNLQRTYRGPDGERVWLYVGYYGTSRGGRPEHTPRGCYTGAGWGIRDARVVVADPTSGLRVQEYLVEREGAEQLVHFWYRSYRRTGMLGGLDQNVDRLLGRLLDGRADGALVRLSTPIVSGDVVAARGRLVSLGAQLDPLLASRWPDERPAGDAAPGLGHGSESAPQGPRSLEVADRSQWLTLGEVLAPSGRRSEQVMADTRVALRGTHRRTG